MGRISKFTYGTACSAFYRPSDPEHIKRKRKAFTDELGQMCVPDGFVTMLSKVWHQIALFEKCLQMDNTCIQGTRVLETHELRRRLRVVREEVPRGSSVLVRMIKYCGEEREPQWMDVEPGRALDFEV